jgi:phage repressor protein C with HTH and peptisase S24 domain
MNVRELIRDRLNAKRLSMKEASEAMGRNHAYLQQFLERGVPFVLPEDAREALAPLLGVKAAELRETNPGQVFKGFTPKGVNDNRSKTARNDAPSTPRARNNAGDRLPVLGSAEGGADGQAPWNGDVVDYVPRPANLAGVPQAYAIYVYGTSMEPRYHPGELAYVHPVRPVRAGDYVLVQLRGKGEDETPRAFLKRLVRQTQSKLVLEQFNPAKTFDVKMADVVSVHRIVGSGEA